MVKLIIYIYIYFKCIIVLFQFHPLVSIFILQISATIGCCHKSCKKTYHLACGLRNGSLLQFCDTYDSYCSDHRPVQEVHKSKDKSIFEAERECGVCFDIMKPIKKLNEKQKRQSLWSPCCNKW